MVATHGQEPTIVVPLTVMTGTDRMFLSTGRQTDSQAGSGVKLGLADGQLAAAPPLLQTPTPSPLVPNTQEGLLTTLHSLTSDKP